MLENILPHTLIEAIKQNYNLNSVYEIRMRRGMPLVLNYLGKNVVVKTKSQEKIIVFKSDIDAVINSATKNSLYAFMNELKQGYITAEGGIRIGVCGEVVLDDSDDEEKELWDSWISEHPNWEKNQWGIWYEKQK